MRHVKMSSVKKNLCSEGNDDRRPVAVCNVCEIKCRGQSKLKTTGFCALLAALVRNKVQSH